jgi:hypothetical protein
MFFSVDRKYSSLQMHIDISTQFSPVNEIVFRIKGLTDIFLVCMRFG